LALQVDHLGDPRDGGGTAMGAPGAPLPPAAAESLGVGRPDRGIGEPEGAGGAAHPAGEREQQRGAAAAGRTVHGDQGGAGQRGGDRTEHGAVVVGQRQVVDLEQWRGRHGSNPRIRRASVLTSSWGGNVLGAARCSSAKALIVTSSSTAVSRWASGA